MIAKSHQVESQARRPQLLGMGRGIPGSVCVSDATIAPAESSTLAAPPDADGCVWDSAYQLLAPSLAVLRSAKMHPESHLRRMTYAIALAPSHLGAIITGWVRHLLSRKRRLDSCCALEVAASIARNQLELLQRPNILRRVYFVVSTCCRSR